MNDLQRYLVDEAVEDYKEGRLSRRETLRPLTGLTGAALAAWDETLAWFAKYLKDT